jgi:wobble nucleotide-excising tRNase
MLKRINYIKHFGVFDDYRRNGDIQDFAEVNIIYGWNYSGKTTISRVFQAFEDSGKKYKENYPDAEFEILDYENNKGNHTNLKLNDYEFKVFNSDFIRDNIHLEGEAFDPILLLGDEAKDAQEKINSLFAKLNLVSKIIKKHQKKKDEILKSQKDGLSKVASEIKEKLKIITAFDYRHTKPIFDEIKNKYKKYLKSDDDVSQLLKIATASEDDKLPTNNKYSPKLDLSLKLEAARTLLNTLPEFSTTIQYFLDNKDVSDWVEDGLKINKGKEKCEYCGNPIAKERTDELLAHFSEDLINHKKLLANLISEIENIKLPLLSVNKSNFYKELWDEFQETADNLNNEITKYNQQCDNIISLLQQKREKPFEKITDLTSVVTNTENLLNAVKKFNDLVDRHNKRTDEFGEQKTNAIETIKKHYVAKFIENENLPQKRIYYLWHSSRENRFSEIETEIETELTKLEATISKAQNGKEKLNEYIQKFLGRDEIKVVVFKEGENERFKLKRNDVKAVNLSEGEKTAIAFSFFLTKLLECKDFKKVIVYIDDPVSSLDSNHIFQINALLREFFFVKEDSENIDSPYLMKFKQIFLSSHNFDFFGLLRKDLPKPKGGNKFYYYVRRINKEKSEFEKLPDSIKNYTSEYHYLFEIIYNFDKSDKNDYQVLMGIPNAVRRFTELYTYSRIPGHYNNSTVDKRATTLWGAEKSKRILKVFHYFSHTNNIERMFKQSDLVCDIENAVSQLIELIKTTDEKHYQELEKALKK